jgi:hypothetical protein
VFSDVHIQEDVLNESVISVFLKEMTDNQDFIVNGRPGVTVPAAICSNESFENSSNLRVG